MDGGAGDDIFIGNGGTDASRAGADGDTILVPGTAAADIINLSSQRGRRFAGHDQRRDDDLHHDCRRRHRTLIKSVLGLAGIDALTVDSTNGAIPIPINYDGGDDSDSLTLTGGTATSDIYTPGPNPGQGTSTIVIGGVTQTVRFSNLEPVIDLVAGPLVVNGNNADNAINYTQGSVAANGLVSIDDFETIEFSNKTTLTINGLAGSDTINLNNPNTPTGLTGITVNGGDPTASDTLIVNGIAGTGDDIEVTPTGTGAGTITNAAAAFVPVTFGTVEHLTLVGQSTGNDALRMRQPTGAGADTFELTFGAAPDAGTVTGFRAGAGGFNFTPANFTGFRRLLSFGGPAVDLTDTLIVNGTIADDVITAADSAANPGILSIIVNGHTEVFFQTNAVLRGLAGNDTFNTDFDPLPAAAGRTIRIEGGDSDPLTDTLNYTAPAGDATTIDLGLATITSGLGANLVTYSGIERINETSSGAASTLTIVGTAGPDSLTYTPTSTTGGTVALLGAIPVVNFTGVGGTFTLDAAGPVGGTDTVSVLGADGVDTVTVTYGAVTTTVAVNTFKPVSLPTANTEALVLRTFEGGDTITLTGTATIATNIDAGDPISGDTLNYTVTGSARVSQGAVSTSGLIDQTGGSNVSYSNVEVLAMNSSTAASTLTVRATHDNDTIAVGNIGIIAVWINDGTVVRYNVVGGRTSRA